MEESPQKEAPNDGMYFEMEVGESSDLEFLSEFHFSEVGHRVEDHAWSVLSNSFFLAGGATYLVLSIWDLHTPAPTGNILVFYYIIAALGPFIFLLDSMIDITWAHVVQERHHAQRYREKIVVEAINIDEPVDALAGTKQKVTFFRRVRKHAGHRRALLSALFFGIASFLAVLDWCVYFFDLSSGIPWFALSIHAYVVSALFAVTGKRSRPWCSAFSLSDADTLEDMGDVFFMVGSIVDMMLCDFHFDDDANGWGVFSSLLWCLDACLYLSSDYVFKKALVKEQKEFLQRLEGDGDEYTVISEGGSKFDSHLLKAEGTAPKTSKGI